MVMFILYYLYSNINTIEEHLLYRSRTTQNSGRKSRLFKKIQADETLSESRSKTSASTGKNNYEL